MILLYASNFTRWMILVFCILQYLLLKILISFNFTSEAILLYHLVPGKSNLTFSRLFRSLRKLRIFLIVNFIERIFKESSYTVLTFCCFANYSSRTLSNKFLSNKKIIPNILHFPLQNFIQKQKYSIRQNYQRRYIYIRVTNATYEFTILIFLIKKITLPTTTKKKKKS